MACSACANPAEPVVPYDEVAQTLGADVATRGGGDVVALADAITLAHGGILSGFQRDELGIVRGTHDGESYLYLVSCSDANGKRLVACGETTASATAYSVWYGVHHAPQFTAAVHHDGIWTIRGIDTPKAWVTGSSWSAYSVTFEWSTDSYFITTDKTSTLIVDLGTLDIAGGSQQATLAVTRHAATDEDFALDGTVVFERPARATITLDDRTYWLDTKTGEVGAATTLY